MRCVGLSGVKANLAEWLGFVVVVVLGVHFVNNN
jgi:putative Mn2+ efflux pump MntP